MTDQKFTQIANSSTPFIATEYGLTMLFSELRNGVIQNWIEYINEYGYTTQQRVTLLFLNNIL